MIGSGKEPFSSRRSRTLGKTHLILDRDPVLTRVLSDPSTALNKVHCRGLLQGPFTEQFRRLLRDSGVQPLRLPPTSPNLNAYAERFVGSIRRECLDRFVVLGQRHLRQIVTEYTAHYNLERNHQGLGNELIAVSCRAANDNGEILCQQRLGGGLKYYCREAA